MPTTTLNRKRLGRWQPKAKRSPRNRRRASPLQMILRLALVALAGQGLWTAFHSPRLRVRRVEVIGADRLGAERVRQLAGLPLGRNIFCLNLYRAHVKVEREPLVASAEVSRALPDAIRILVRERRPVFVVAHAGQFYEVDGEGVLFRRIPRPIPKIPLLALTRVGPLAVGQRVRADIMKPALACLEQTAADRLRLWKINVDGPHELCLNMKVPSGSHMPGKTLRVRLGRSDDLALKLADARKVLAGRPQVVEEAQYLDVSCAGRPVYMAQASTGATPVSARGNTRGASPPGGVPAPPLRP
jgi:POTRA domain-containing FtsQ-type protein